MLIRQFSNEDQLGVIDLWQRCELVRSWNDPERDIERKLLVNPEWFLVGVDEGELVASVMVGYEGHRGWVNYLAVSPGRRGEGFGALMMLEAESLLLNAGCPKLNLQVRGTNLAAVEFYGALGYVRDDVVSFGKRLIVDD